MTDAGSAHQKGGREPPEVSCVIIFLNEERFLAEAIDSVIAQSFTSWELLLVDDGSTDGSEDIARRYAARVPRQIRYLTHDDRANLGMSASRNLGIQHARGTYIAFLDGDDCWFSNKLESQVELFEAHPEAEMVCGATLYWTSWATGRAEDDHITYTGDVGCGSSQVTGLQQDRLYEAPALAYALYPLAWGATPSASGYMIRRELALRVDGFENRFRGVFEDQVFRAKAFLAGSVFVSRMCFDKYRQHPESSVHVARRTGEIERARRAFFAWYLDFAEKNFPADRRLRQSIKRAAGRNSLAARISRALRRLWRTTRF